MALPARRDGTLGDFTPLVPLIAFLTDWLASLARFNRFNLSTLGTLLVFGGVAIASNSVALTADRLAICTCCHRLNLSAHRTLLVSNVTRPTDRLMEAGARIHILDLSTFGTLLVSGKVAPVAVRADQLVGLTTTENMFVSFTDTANTFHKITSFQIWSGFVFKKSEVGSLTFPKKLL